MKVKDEDVKELARLERALNGDTGIQCVRVILKMLEGGYYESAQRVRAVEGDKTRQFPELEPVLYRMFGCRLHGVHGCDGWLCQREKADP